jgi:hypothetical protein
MAHSSLIRKNEDCFNLAQKIIQSLSETYKFTFDDGWKLISSQTVVQLQKKFKKQKKANNPLSAIKKPRTSFSFFTKENRNNIQKKNPNATFGELSKLVSVAWKTLSDKEMKHYKNLETKDKKRYAVEKEKILSSLPKEEKETIPSTEEEEKPVTSIKSTNKSSDKLPRKKTSKPKGDKNTSKHTGSYNVFQKKQRAILKSESPNLSLTEQNSMLGKMWKGFSAQEKSTYV